MTPEREKRVLDVFQSAVEQEPSRRARFLAEACAGDPALGSKVESLLHAHEQAGSFLESPPVEPVLEARPVERMVGREISHYRVIGAISRGGIGEVYLAQDHTLGSKVALKLVRSDVTFDRERLARFQREVRAVSALNHPNIFTIHEVGEHETSGRSPPG